MDVDAGADGFLVFVFPIRAAELKPVIYGPQQHPSLNLSKSTKLLYVMKRQVRHFGYSLNQPL